MKHVKLMTPAYAGGVLRQPGDGVLLVEDEEAARLLESNEAEDVTADFVDQPRRRAATKE